MRSMIQLISCDNCGVVLDASKLDFPEDIYHRTPEGCSDYDRTKSIYDSARGEVVAKVDCPVCQSPVP